MCIHPIILFFQQRQMSPVKRDEAYNPDWEILMLAESLEEDDQLSQKNDSPPSSSGTRRRSLRPSSSVDPQTSSAKSRKRIANWYWSFPPPENDTSRRPKNIDGK